MKKKNLLLFFDVETTGLPTSRDASYLETEEWPRIVSISWAMYTIDSDLVFQRNHIIKPEGFTIPYESTRIHRISDEYARKHGEDMLDILVSFETDIAARKPSKIIAHNMAFDKNVVMSEYVRAGMETTLEEIEAYCTMTETTHYCQILRPYKDEYKWPKLEELHKKLFGISFENAHDAATDVRACARCYFEYASRQHYVTKRSPSSYAESLIDSVLFWSNDNDWFDCSFVCSLQDQLNERGRLTASQIEALENIIDGFDI